MLRAMGLLRATREHTLKLREGGGLGLPTLKMPPFCQAIFSMVSPRMLVWSMPKDETPHTTGALGTQRGSVPAVPPPWGHQALAAPGDRLGSAGSYLMMLVQS